MKIKICSMDISVNEQLVNQLDSQIDGCVDWDSNQIIVKGTIKQDRKDAVIAHEILHVLLEDSGAMEYLKNHKVEDSETLVMILEKHFYQFLIDNTNFFTK